MRLISSIIFSIVFYSCAFNCDYYLNKKIKPLLINGIVISKSEKNCFGIIIFQGKIKRDTLNNICVCTPENEGLWNYVKSGDSIYKNKNDLIVKVIRYDSLKSFKYPCCSE